MEPQEKMAHAFEAADAGAGGTEGDAWERRDEALEREAEEALADLDRVAQAPASVMGESERVTAPGPEDVEPDPADAARRLLARVRPERTSAFAELDRASGLATTASADVAAMVASNAAITYALLDIAKSIRG